MRSLHFDDDEIALHVSEHRGDDDLLTAGLGLEGLRRPLTPPADESPSAAELRRRAIHCNWNGIAHLRDRHFDWAHPLSTAQPGVEIHALLRVPGCRHGHRVLLQLPDGFDPARPRLLATAVSGSRGIYGAIALASAWGLPRGFAVISTDKGCGTDWYDQDSGLGAGLDGLPTEDPAAQVFHPQTRVAEPHAVLIKHVHSQDNPEQHWGASLNQAIRFAWALLEQHFGARLAPPAARRSLAVGLSNGGAAVLQSLQLAPRVDAAVAVAPNVCPRQGGRAFLDYVREAALWMPLVQAAPSLADAPSPLPPQAVQHAAERAYADLCEAGLLRAVSLKRAQTQAYRRLRRRGWPRQTLRAARLSTVFDFWYAGAVAYTQALGRFDAADNPLDCYYATVDAGVPRASTALERRLWWSDSAGIVPGLGVGIMSRLPRAKGLQRLSAVLDAHAVGDRIRRGQAALRCGPPVAAVPLLVVHGEDDGLIPPAFSSEPYARMAQRAGAELAYWRVPAAPHFDAFLGLAGYGEHYRALLPIAFQALDAAWLRVERGLPLPAEPAL